MTTIVNIVTRDDTSDAVLDTVQLATNNATLLEYGVTTPDNRVTEYTSNLRNGRTVGQVTLDDVTESLSTLIERDNDDDLLAVRRQIEHAFHMAALRQKRKRGPRVFVEFQLDRRPTMYRSEIKHGRLLSDADDIGVGWRTRQMQLELAWIRNWYWEATLLQELYLRSKATSRTLGGVTLANTTDATYGNWIEVLGSDIPGGLPTPIDLRLTNTNGSGAPLALHAALNIDADPTNINQVLEAEAATWYGTQSTPTSTTYSGGSAKQVEWASDAETLIANWNLSSTLLDQLDGAWSHIFARFVSVPAGVWLRLEVRYLSLRVLASTPAMQTTTDIYQRIGSLQLPPRITNSAPPALELRLYARKAGGANLTMDCLHLMVADGYASYTSKGYGLQPGAVLTDNAITGRVDPLIFVKEGEISLRPNTTQRLHVLQTGGGDQTGRTLTARAYYRERRLTI